MRNVLTVATGTAGAQAITMAFAPVITRLYGPEAYGVMGVFMSTVAVLTPIAALTYPIAIVLPKDDRDAKAIARLSVLISILVFLLLSSCLLTFGDTLLTLLNLESISSFLLFIPIYMLLSAWLQVIQQWLIRKKQYKITAKVAVSQAAVVSGTKAGFGWQSPTSTALIVISTLGIAFQILQLLAAIEKSENAENFSKKSKALRPFTGLKELAYRHRDFPFFRAPQVFINAASQSLPVIMLASLFGPAAAGFYSIGKTVLGLPTTLIGKSVSDVFYPRITETFNEGKSVNKLLVKATGSLALVCVVPFSIVIIFGPSLFEFVFGQEWIKAGEYASWMALWSMFAFINRPSVSVIPVLGLQSYFLIYEVFSLLSRGAALFIGFYIYSSDVTAVILFSITSAFLNAILITFTIRFARKSDSKRFNI